MNSQYVIPTIGPDGDIDFKLPSALRKQGKDEVETGEQGLRAMYDSGMKSGERYKRARVGAHGQGVQRRNSKYAHGAKAVGQSLGDVKRAALTGDSKKIMRARKNSMMTYKEEGLDVQDCDTMLLDFLNSPDCDVDLKYVGFNKLKGALAKKGAYNPGALAAFIGRNKYGKKKFQSSAAKDKKMKNMEHDMASSWGSDKMRSNRGIVKEDKTPNRGYGRIKMRNLGMQNMDIVEYDIPVITPKGIDFMSIKRSVKGKSRRTVPQM